ncbi:M23 family metallopeptidase [Cloacibacterium sp.]|uniref:M23 family metallopeptidase n=1 Tax=Cloacibacterium sp. TaxID=1913682 RepID=UPI0035AEE1DD
MKQFFEKKKNTHFFIGALLIIILAQSFAIAKLYSSKDDKNYEVNLVKINTKKDSLDLFSLKNNLAQIDQTVRNLNGFFRAKNIPNLSIEALAKDSLSSYVYLTNQSSRYSEYLVELEKKLQQVPLGIPTDGHLSSNFGKRVNPIPSKKLLFASVKPIGFSSVEKDSAGNIINKSANSAKLEGTQAPAEKDQMQFHKGVDIAAPMGTDVYCAAQGKVIFAGQKSGYGNCVIIEHGNGLATLYGHLSKILVDANQQVKIGDVIAKVGSTGRSTGPHLHYEVRKNNTPINPKLFLNL